MNEKSYLEKIYFKIRNAKMNEKSYFEWLYNLIKRDKSYILLSNFMYEIKFEPKIIYDINRAFDGNNLKGDYILEIYGSKEYKNIDFHMPAEQNCSILEMIIGISKRMWSELCDDSLENKDFSDYFWEIIENLDLIKYDDDKIGSDYEVCKFEILKILTKLNERKYKKNGIGGMFPLLNPPKNQRFVEIWYQMQFYINEKYKIKDFYDWE